MTRSFKIKPTPTTHDYKIATSPPKHVKKNGAGRFGWGSFESDVQDGLREVKLDQKYVPPASFEGDQYYSSSTLNSSQLVRSGTPQPVQ